MATLYDWLTFLYALKSAVLTIVGEIRDVKYLGSPLKIKETNINRDKP